MLPTLPPNTTAALLSWGLQSTLVLGAGWLLYRYTLQQERFFGYNQRFLVLMPWLALLGPLLVRAALPGLLRHLPIAATGALVQAQLPGLTVRPTAALANAGINFYHWLPGLYLLGVAVLLLRLLAQVAHLWLATRQLPRTPGPGYVLVHTGGQRPVSSFGRWIFWDDTAPLTPAEARTVLAHEVAHVRQGHTRQRLLLEVVRSLLWFTPFAHLFPRALAQTHEFLADAAALRTLQPAEEATTDPASYAALLARQALHQLAPNLALAHSFTQSLTLTRIRMLTTAAPVHRWKRWLPLPLSAGLLLLVACEQDLDNVLPPPPPPPAPLAEAHTPPPPPPPAYKSVEQMPEYAGGQAQLMTDLAKLTQYPAEALAEKLQGKVLVQFFIVPTGAVEALSIAESSPRLAGSATAVRQLQEAALNAVRNLPGKWTPGRKNGQPVAVVYTVPIQFSLN